MSDIKVTTLRNSNGAELAISNLGATIIAINMPDRTGELVNVVVGLKAEDYTSESYLNDYTYLGASVGRYAGRISRGGFELNGEKYKVYEEEGVHLHGGKVGFDKKFWTVDSLSEGENPSIVFSCESKHLEEGYPGNVMAKVRYTLTEQNEVKVSYSATSDKATPINLTNHAYFNLNGEGTVLDHNLMINAYGTLDVSSQLLPSGKINESKGTRFDFSKKEGIGRADFIGFDDTFVLDEGEVKAVLEAPKTGIKMVVKTNQPASVIYTPKELANLNYTNGVKYKEFSAICFETQNFPDAPNNDNFPSSILNPGEVYENNSIFEFSLL